MQHWSMVKSSLSLVNGILQQPGLLQITFQERSSTFICEIKWEHDHKKIQ
jgi:hypothetical protein